jgi:hypothetical protein
MAIEIGPFTVHCTECGHTRPISRYNARTPEAMVLFADSVEETHKCHAPQSTPAIENTDRWSTLIKRFESELNRPN